MIGPGYYPVGISNYMLEIIKKIILKTKPFMPS
jgi:hypothetical protein